MPCFKPIQGWRAQRLNENGKRPIVFKRRDAYLDMPVTVPCGRCIGCRLDKSRQWAIRCMHESQLYESNSFITLTFKDSCLPKDNSIDVKIFQDFMKRFRKKCSGITPVWNEKKGCNDYPIRFLHCGEYGANKGRPHYHACIFNYDFPDKEHWSTHNNFKYYRSKTLEKLWPFGHSLIGNLTFESAAYVSRYITKKITGEAAITHYNEIDYTTGELLAERKPEYATMSRRPGLGKMWYEKFKDDVYPSDYIIINGKKVRPPKFYDKMFEEEHPMDYAFLKLEREKKNKLFEENNTDERLLVRETIQNRKFAKLKRSYEND